MNIILEFEKPMKSFKSYFFFFSAFFCLGLCLPLLQGLALLTSEQKVDPEELVDIAATAIFLGLCSGFYFGSIAWSMSDATKRGKFGCLVGLMVAFMPIMGLFLWLVFRPPS